MPCRCRETTFPLRPLPFSFDKLYKIRFIKAMNGRRGRIPTLGFPTGKGS